MLFQQLTKSFHIAFNNRYPFNKCLLNALRWSKGKLKISLGKSD